MRMGLVNRKSIAPLLIAVSLAAAPGCKSGWKMPSPSNMWPWNRQPSAETLAGTPTKPTVESPSTKYTPSPIASVAAGTTKSATTTPSATGSVYPSASLASTTSKPTYGGAANANGYQIGPYGMSGQAPTQTPPASSTGYPGGAQVPTNAYAGTAGLPSSTMPPAGTPNTSNPYAPPVTPAAPQLGNVAGTQPSNPYSMPNASPQGGSSMPQYQPNLPPVPGQATTTTVGFPANPYGATSVSLPPSSYSAPNTPTAAAPSMPQLPPMPGATSYGPTSPVPPTTGDAYRPGSTGRTNNNYNFSTGSATVPVNSGSYTPSQPAPASTPSYGNFQLPPNTANAGGQPTVR